MATKLSSRFTKPFRLGVMLALGFTFTFGVVFAFEALTTTPGDAGNQSYDSPIFSDGNSGNGAYDPTTDSLEALRNKLDLFPWSKNGSDAYYTAGNVGIGTTSPDALLQIGGGIDNSINNPSTTVYVAGNSGQVVSLRDEAADIETYLASGWGGGFIGTYTNHPLYLRTNNTDRAVILANGNVGIGATTPAGKLVVAGSTLIGGTNTMKTALGADLWNSELQVDNASNSQGIATIRNDNSAYGGVMVFAKGRSDAVVQNNDRVGQVDFVASDGSNFSNTIAQILASVDGTPGTDDTPGRITFSTTADGSMAPTERMRITSGGNVGIGTTSPGATLEVNPSKTSDAQYEVARFSASGGTSGQLRVTSGRDAGSISGRIVKMQVTDGVTVNSLLIQPDGGNVGIGTSSPGAKLHVSTEGYDAKSLYVSSSTGAATTDLAHLHQGAGNSDRMILHITNGKSDGKSLIVEQGRVGIGNTSPQSYLQVGTPAASGYQYLQIDTEGSAPAASDCDSAAEAGRIIVDNTFNRLYVCIGASGWKYSTLN